MMSFSDDKQADIIDDFNTIVDLKIDENHC